MRQDCYMRLRNVSKQLAQQEIQRRYYQSIIGATDSGRWVELIPPFYGAAAGATTLKITRLWKSPPRTTGR